MRAPSGLIAIYFCLLSSCATPPMPDQCQVGNIDQVFGSPLTFNGERFCGYGYFYATEESSAIYAAPVRDRYSRPDVAFLLDAETQREPGAQWPPRQNARVYVEGLMESERCNQPDASEGCTPVPHAIFLTDWVVIQR